MGTSKGYTPPTGHLWTDAKKAVTHMIKNNASSETIGNAMSKYVSAQRSNGGGIHRGKQESVARTGVKAAAFINAVQNYGLTEALKQSGLQELVAKTPDEVLVGLLDYFTEEGSTLDESVVRDSMSEIMREKFTDKNGDKNMEDQIKNINILDFMLQFVIKCIQKDFFSTFAEKILSQCKNTKEKMDMQNNIKNFIKIHIESNYTKQEIMSINWNSDQGRNIIEQMHENTANIFLKWGEDND